MLMNYHIGRLVLSSLCVGIFVAAGIRWCSFCRLKLASACKKFYTRDRTPLIFFGGGRASQ